jgi:hypothetical protein
MTDDQVILHIELQLKLLALTLACQKMLQLRTPATQERVDIQIQSAEFEIGLVQAMMSLLQNNGPIQMPSAQTVAEMQASTAALQTAAANSELVEAVIDATSDAIAAWPKA